MKSTLLLALLCSSLSYAAPTVCRNENKIASKETIFISEGQILMAVCQRSTIPGTQKLSNEEICANDMFLLQGSSSGPSGGISSFVSQKTSVVFTLSTDSKGLKTASVNTPYEASTLKGGNKVSIPNGAMFVSCK